MAHELAGLGGQTRYLTVGLQFLGECGLIHQLLSVIVVALPVGNEQITGFEFVFDLGQHS